MHHWSNVQILTSQSNSKQLFKEARLSGRQGGVPRSKARGRKGAGKKGKSQVTKTHHILDKPFHHITTLHHTENNALFLWEGGPYLHTPTTCSYLRRYKLELLPGTAQHQIREMGCRKVCK